MYSLTSWTVKDCAEKVSASTGDHPALQSSSPSPTGKAAISRCSGDKLSFKETEGEGDIGGKSYAKFLFTNISSSPCMLYGYPSVVLLNRKGQPMPGVKVENDPESESEKPKRVTLDPGKSAWFQIFYTDGMISASRKHPALASYKIKVRAPQTTKAFVIKSEIRAYKQAVVFFVREGLPT